MDLVLEMRRRVRNHMLVSLAALGAAFVLMSLSVGVIPAVAGGASWAGPATMIAALASISLLPIVGFTSTFRNLRCPACDGLVAFQVSRKYSAFGSLASNECRHCGKTIFAPTTGRRFLVWLVVLAVLGFFFAGAVIATTDHASRTSPSSSAP